VSLWRRDVATALLGDGDSAATAGGRRSAEQRADGVASGFEAWLDSQPLRRGSRVACVLGGDAVRHAVVPWVTELSSAAQRQRLAEQTFREAFGDVALGWTVRQHGQRHGAASLACATETALLDRLDALARARGLSLHSVQSRLVQAFNAAHRRLGAGLCWFVLAEAQSTSLLLISPQEALRVTRVPAAGAALPVLLNREWFALGMDAARPPVYVAGPAAGRATAAAGGLGAAADWRFVVLDPAPAGSDAAPAAWGQAA